MKVIRLGKGKADDSYTIHGEGQGQGQGRGLSLTTFITCINDIINVLRNNKLRNLEDHFRIFCLFV